MGIADQLVTRLVKCGINQPDIRGCSAAEIKRLQTKPGLRCPQTTLRFCSRLVAVQASL